MSEIIGIDISSWQADINNLNDLSPAPDFFIMKATGGTRLVDNYCDRFVQQAKAIGKPYGFYHFADDGYGLDPVNEANFFVENCKNYFNDGIPVIDWECNDSHRTDLALKFLDRVYEITGVKSLIYMNANCENSYDWSKVVAGDYGIWLAGYPYNQPIEDFRNSSQLSCPYSLRNWDFAIMWQYTSNGRLNGYYGALDCNQFYGDLETWKAYATSHKASSAPSKSKPSNSGKLDLSFDIDDLAHRVLRGEYGNGEERANRLGELYEPVQNRVNEILRIDELARAVIRGDYGNGQERANRLGDLYEPVQNRVNEILGCE